MLKQFLIDVHSLWLRMSWMMEGKFDDREDLEMLGFSLIFVYI